MLGAGIGHKHWWLLHLVAGMLQMGPSAFGGLDATSWLAFGMDLAFGCNLLLPLGLAMPWGC